MSKQKKINNLTLDDKQYWKDRHSNISNLKASGLKSVGLKSNSYIYKIVSDQYLKLLSRLDLSNVTSVIDCGFGDGYFIDFYNTHFPGIKVYGVDISKTAKSKVNFVPKKQLFVSDLANFKPGKKFDMVHSFDVLYHILNNEDYVNSLKNMSALSNKYLVLHEKFLAKPPRISSSHVRFRSSEYTNQILNSLGFYIVDEIPTHFWAVRFFTYRLNKFMPDFLYRLDNYIANNLHPSAQESMASHRIRVYKKAR